MNAENMKLWLQRMLTALVGEGHLSHVEANGLAANIREEIDNGINEIARLGIELATANDNELKADKGWRESSTRIIALEAQLNQRRELYRKLQEELAAKSAEGAKANELEQRVKELEARLQQQLDLYATLQGELAAKSAEGAKDAVGSSRLEEQNDEANRLAEYVRNWINKGAKDNQDMAVSFVNQLLAIVQKTNGDFGTLDKAAQAYKAQAEENARQLHAAISRAEFAERECQRNLVNWHESQHQLRSKLDQEAVLEQQVDDLRHALHASRVLCESLNEPGPTPPCVGGYKANALAEGGVE